MRQTDRQPQLGEFVSERERGGDTQREKASKIEKKYIEIKSRNRGREGEMSERER